MRVTSRVLRLPFFPRSSWRRVATPRTFMAAHASSSTTPPRFTNALALEESPYLRQHAHNPVDWLPWGEAAFARAMAEQKPIFLSVGYSTCHWCHVMERESFESEAVARVLNTHFVCVKVDREERPDVDRVYMSYVQATSGGGGWPMSVWLTPDLHPFLGGTYFPPEDAHDRKGFTTVLNLVATLWQTKRAQIEDSATDAMLQLRAALEPRRSEPAAGTADDAGRAVAACAQALLGRYDSVHGGFGGAPKFPRPCELNALLASVSVAPHSANAPTAKGAVRKTLRAWCAGGVYDHVGGGFARYSVDELFHVPHFEKMLYDNAQMAATLCDASLALTEPAFAETARGVLDYLVREMTHPEGGLFSAEDADSVEPSSGSLREGWFYCWRRDDAQAALERAGEGAWFGAFAKRYDVQEQGNATASVRSDPHGEFRGLNVLRVAPGETPERDSAEVAAALGRCRRVLYDARGAGKPRPRRDEKVIAAWNGLAVSALARAARLLGAPPAGGTPSWPVSGCAPGRYLEAASHALAFLRDKLYDSETHTLRRSFLTQPSAAHGYADDYAALALACIDMYEASGEFSHLRWALHLLRTLEERFLDAQGGGYYATQLGDAAILLRLKDDYDGAEVAASSLAAQAHARLATGLLSGDAANTHQAALAATQRAFASRLTEQPLAMPALAAALAPVAASPAVCSQVVIAGAPGTSGVDAMLDVAWRCGYSPMRRILVVDVRNSEAVAFWQEHNPVALATAMQASTKSADAVAVVCQGQTCKAPSLSAEELEVTLMSGSGGAPAELKPFRMG